MDNDLIPKLSKDEVVTRQESAWFDKRTMRVFGLANYDTGESSSMRFSNSIS